MYFQIPGMTHFIGHPRAISGEVQVGNRACGVERFRSAESAAPIPDLGILQFDSHAWN
jgi:hypothetical protein